MLDPQVMLPILQMILAFCNIIILAYALFKFLNKPKDTLEEQIRSLKAEIEALKVEIKDVKQALHQGNDKFRKQDDLNEVFINCMLAFIDFEMAYCSATGYKEIEDLEAAKGTLRKYLARK